MPQASIVSREVRIRPKSWVKPWIGQQPPIERHQRRIVAARVEAVEDGCRNLARGVGRRADPHAAAAVDQQGDAGRRGRLGPEVENGLRFAGIDDLQVLLRQRRDDPVAAVAHDGGHRDDVDGGAEDHDGA